MRARMNMCASGHVCVLLTGPTRQPLVCVNMWCEYPTEYSPPSAFPNNVAHRVPFGPSLVSSPVPRAVPSSVGHLSDAILARPPAGPGMCPGGAPAGVIPYVSLCSHLSSVAVHSRPFLQHSCPRRVPLRQGMQPRPVSQLRALCPKPIKAALKRVRPRRNFRKFRQRQVWFRAHISVARNLTIA